MHLTLGLFCLSSHTEVNSCERLLEILSFGIWQQLGWLAPPDYKICTAISPHCHNLRRWPTSWNYIRDIPHLAKYHEWADWEWLRQRRTHSSGSFLCVLNNPGVSIVITTFCYFLHTGDRLLEMRPIQWRFFACSYWHSTHHWSPNHENQRISTQDTSNYALCLGCPTESFHGLPLSKTESQAIAGSVPCVASPPTILRCVYFIRQFFGAFMLQECISYESASQST